MAITFHLSGCWFACDAAAALQRSHGVLQGLKAADIVHRLHETSTVHHRVLPTLHPYLMLGSSSTHSECERNSEGPRDYRGHLLSVHQSSSIPIFNHENRTERRGSFRASRTPTGRQQLPSKRSITALSVSWSAAGLFPLTDPVRYPVSTLGRARGEEELEGEEVHRLFLTSM